ncbi:MAG: hypothetical protein KatS3mg061_3376 [Dehalococcoidia bacterium]|nr:MAG: hypothetical protein KatS3mg061_3376 [Dehalococcoidia bacterium]
MSPGPWSTVSSAGWRTSTRLTCSRANFSPGYTFIAADEGDAMVMASYPLDDLDAESLEALVGDVAAWAQALREEFASDVE